MEKLQRIALGAALTATAAGLGVAGAAANAATAAPGHSTQEAASRDGGASVKANERVVEAFLQDVINEHNGDHAANYLNPDMQWSGGTVGTVTGRANVAGLSPAWSPHSPTRTSPSMTSSVRATRSWCAWS